MKQVVVKPGQRYGRLTVVESVGPTKDRSGKPSHRYTCLCECGRTTIVRVGHLRSGHTLSCGCLNKDMSAKANTKHGHARRGRKTRAYRAYMDMRYRCENANSKPYGIYGAKGISVCGRWRESFDNFLTDMGIPPQGMSLDRIDNNLGYEPSNCRWASVITQNNNRSNNRLIRYGIHEFTISQWARYLHLHRNTLSERLKRGWPIWKALFTKANLAWLKAHGNATGNAQ